MHWDHRSPPAWRLAAFLALVLLTASCDYGGPGIKTTPTLEAGVRTVRLLDVELSLHFAQERQGIAGRPMVLFATGDGGWRGIDREIADAIARLGYPVAGFSSREYLDHLDRLQETPTPAQVGMDYSILIDNARQAMSIPASTSVVLSGFSRGAALAVIAAGHSGLRPSLRGVLAMGLDDVEEHVQVKTYEYLKSLALPVAVIQSTHDRFLDAAKARRLFGADTGLHVLHAIEAQSHTFSGARPLLFRELEASLAWIENAAPAAVPQP